MDVFNGSNVSARNLLAMTPSDDKFVEENIPCTARIHVESAHFKSMYRGTLLPVPYMEILGSIGSVYIEDENRFFPCGTNEMKFMQSQDQPVRVRYCLSVQELQELVGMGLYEPDFQPPANLINNVLEVPVKVTYKGIYDTPCCIVEVQDAFEIDTTTHDAMVDGKQIEGNGYEGMFFGCLQSEFVSKDKVYGYAPDIGYVPHKIKEENYDKPLDVAPQVETVNEPELSDDELAEIKHIEKVNAQIKDATHKHTSMLEGVDKSDVKSFLHAVKAEAAAQEEANRTEDYYGNDFWNDTPQEEKVKDNSRLSNSYDLLKTMAEKQVQTDAQLREKEEEKSGKKAAEVARRTDIASDNMALNEGITDIAGYGSSSASETPAQIKEKKDAKSGKKAIENARRNDIAADNKALNEGITDIAGHGAASKESRAASDLVANLLKPSNNNPSGPNFL